MHREVILLFSRKCSRGALIRPIAAHATVVETGLLTVRAPCKAAVFAEVAECARSGTGAALRTHFHCLLPAGVGIVSVDARGRVPRAGLCKSGPRDCNSDQDRR